MQSPTSCFPRCVSETPRLRMNATNSFACFTRSISALSISIRFGRFQKSCQEESLQKSQLLTEQANDKLLSQYQQEVFAGKMIDEIAI
jgi:hypothetical protein